MNPDRTATFICVGVIAACAAATVWMTWPR